MKYHEYWSEFLRLRDTVPEEKRAIFDQRFSNRQKNPVLILGFSFFLGWLGIDRFLLGNAVYGVVKLVIGVTSQVLGLMDSLEEPGGFTALSLLLSIPILVDFFLVTARTRALNLTAAQEEARLTA